MPHSDLRYRVPAYPMLVCSAVSMDMASAAVAMAIVSGSSTYPSLHGHTNAC